MNHWDSGGGSVRFPGFSVEIWHLHVCLLSLLGIGIASYPLLHVRM